MILYCDAKTGKINSTSATWLGHSGLYVDECFRIVTCVCPKGKEPVEVLDFGAPVLTDVPICCTQEAMDYAAAECAKGVDRADIRNVQTVRDVFEPMLVNPILKTPGRWIKEQSAVITCKHIYPNAQVRFQPIPIVADSEI